MTRIYFLSTSFHSVFAYVTAPERVFILSWANRYSGRKNQEYKPGYNAQTHAKPKSKLSHCQLPNYLPTYYPTPPFPQRTISKKEYCASLDTSHPTHAITLSRFLLRRFVYLCDWTTGVVQDFVGCLCELCFLFVAVEDCWCGVCD